MRAFILAGGFGTRLRSIISDQPKPMADIEDKPFLAHQIEYLRAQGVSHVILCLGYLYDQVMAYFGNGDSWGVQIDYSIESTPLGTGGALKLAEPFIDDTFLLLNGDSFIDIKIDQLVGFHLARRKADTHCVGTLALTTVPDASQYGSVLLNDNLQITDFVEKAARSATSENTTTAPGLINAGVYVLEPTILEVIPERQKVSMERTVFPGLLDNGSHLYGYEGGGFFVDIGTPDGYFEFCEYVKTRVIRTSDETISEMRV